MLASALSRYRTLSRNARLYVISNTIQSVSVGAAVILYTLFLNALGYHNTFISAALFVGALGGALGILPAGLLVDRLGWRAMLLWSDLLGGGALFVQFLVPTPLVTLATSVVAGLSVAMVIVVNAPLLTANSSPTERIALFGLSNASGFLASVVGSLLGGFLPEWFAQPAVAHSPPLTLIHPLLVASDLARSYQLALLFTGALAIPSLIPVLLMHENRAQRGVSGPHAGAIRGRSAGPWGSLRSVIVALRGRLVRWWALGRVWWTDRRRRLGQQLAALRRHTRGPMVRFTASQALIALGAGIFAPYVSIYFVRDLHASTAYYGVLSSILTIALAGASLLAAPLAERFGKLWLPLVAECCSLPFLILLGAAPVLAIASLAYLARGFLMNMGSPALSTFYMEAVPEQQRGLASSVYNGVWQGIWAFGAVLGGPVSDAGGNRILFFIAAILYAGSIILLAVWFLRPATRTDVPADDATTRDEVRQRSS